MVVSAASLGVEVVGLQLSYRTALILHLLPGIASAFGWQTSKVGEIFLWRKNMGKLTRCVGRGRVGQSTQQCPQGQQGPDSEQDMEPSGQHLHVQMESRYSVSFGDLRAAMRSWHSIMGSFPTKQFRCHTQQISEEAEDHYLLNISDLNRILFVFSYLV